MEGVYVFAIVCHCGCCLRLKWLTLMAVVTGAVRMKFKLIENASAETLWLPDSRQRTKIGFLAIKDIRYRAFFRSRLRFLLRLIQQIQGFELKWSFILNLGYLFEVMLLLNGD
ncbi:hypothetical protein AAHA92_09062 [Salvia divinorum]|uniref:Uncharacterized protein n=1 Tax=Salvia divinorum TaxID=28513 RepID=A0ABD1HRL7_SALDI